MIKGAISAIGFSVYMVACLSAGPLITSGNMESAILLFILATLLNIRGKMEGE